MINKKMQNPLTVEHLLAGTFLLGIVISYVYNGFLQSKPTNHLIAYFVTFGLFFGFINQLLNELGPSEKNVDFVLKWLTIMMVFVSCFAVAEFGVRMAIGVNIGDFLPRPFRGEYDSSTLDKFLVRVRGFTEESGQHAFISEAFMPLCIYYLIYRTNWPGLIKGGLIGLLIVSFLLAFSAGALVALGLALGVMGAYYFVFRRISVGTIFKLVIGVLVAYLAILALLDIDLFATLYAIVEAKLNGGGSLNDRSSRMDEFWIAYLPQPIYHKLLGFGPSGFRILGLEKSILSLYPTFMNEGGIISLSTFLLFLTYTFWTIVRIEGVAKLFLLVSFVACVVHYIAVADYFRPWFWFFTALVFFISRVESEAKIAKV
ncbi:hypothetical protein FUA23_03920 [Neolewinella aurantiaca]|uniref:Oligosaccharide repeat unit polymerase n=1 Tax=Neolewinella aurantiaca TaxID=2602767 RepID=A0A5C7FZ02_9BACT|nr:hypothetical protein [Neolewinella aurantiaca]TXF90957.1 hypothetical protein FUA23_03920 [Neolewinella aurantiaca]